jgi:hypothetical protein
MSIYHVSIGLTSQGRYLVLTSSYEVFDWFLLFSATFNNISAKSWWSVLLVEETTDLP